MRYSVFCVAVVVVECSFEGSRGLSYMECYGYRARVALRGGDLVLRERTGRDLEWRGVTALLLGFRQSKA